MTDDSDLRLRALLADDGLPERDVAFRVAVLERIEKHELAADLAWRAVLVIGIGLALAVLTPNLAGLLSDGAIQALGAALAALSLIGLLDFAPASPRASRAGRKRATS